MQHTVEQLIKKINAMHDKALELHRERNKYSKLSDKSYDKSTKAKNNESASSD